jgi:putative SOS response-associated peptidase YedK
MCNRYEQKGSVSAIRALARKMGRELKTTPKTDNMPMQESVYPDQDAPVMVNGEASDLTLVMMRWGFPPIPNEKDLITNIRNLKSRWWQDVNRDYLLDQKYRCLVPFTAFAEPVRQSTWFNVPEVEVACFAGIWRPWQGERLAEQPGQKRRTRERRVWQLYAFLTTEANDVVRPVHPKAMPVLLVDPAEQAEWMMGGEESLRLQRPFSNDALTVRENESSMDISN